MGHVLEWVDVGMKKRGGREMSRVVLLKGKVTTNERVDWAVCDWSWRGPERGEVDQGG